MRRVAGFILRHEHLLLKMHKNKRDDYEGPPWKVRDEARLIFIQKLSEALTPKQFFSFRGSSLIMFPSKISPLLQIASVNVTNYSSAFHLAYSIYRE